MDLVDVAISPDGGARYVAAGYSYSHVWEITAFTTLPGAVLWSHLHPGIRGANAGEPVGVSVSPDGRTVHAPGRMWVRGETNDFAVVGIETLTGIPLYTEQWGGHGGGSDMALDMVMAPDASRIVLAGYTGAWGTDSDIIAVGFAVPE